MNKLCTMCGRKLERPGNTPDLCTKCDSNINRQRGKLKGKTAVVSLEVDAFEHWLLKQIAKKLDRKLSAVIWEAWDEACGGVIGQHLHMYSVETGEGE